MSRAVPRSAGHPVGMSKRRTAKPAPQSVDFDYFDGMGARVDREIRAAEDALMKYIEDEQKRESLYASTTSGLEDKYPATKKEGVR